MTNPTAEQLVVASRPTPPYLLAIDGGTESLRCAFFDLGGRLVASASDAYATTFPRSGWAEQNPEDWLESLIKATRACMAKANITPRDVVGIGLDATTCTLVALSDSGQVLQPALLWMDVRSARQAHRIFSTNDPALRYNMAGCNAEWMPAKALWLAENVPDTFAATRHFMEYADWLVYRLTGRITLGLNTVTQRWYYNSRTGGWPLSLFSAMGLPDLADKFPREILAPGRIAGELSRDAAEALGLPPGIAVIEGGGDAFISMLGLGVTRPGGLGLITGSSNVLCSLSADELHAPGLYGAFPDAVVPGLFLVEAGQTSTGSILAWFVRNFAPDLAPSHAFAELDRAAANLQPGAGGLIVLDHFQGSRTPHSDSEARGAVWGLSLHTNRVDLYRAIMESVAFGTNQVLQTLGEHGQTAQRVRVCGGAARSPVFMQIYCDVCSMPFALTEVANAPLLGDAILAATGLGYYPDLHTAAESMVRETTVFFPNAGAHQEYQTYYRLYQRTYGQLRDLMHEMVRHPKA
jgi:ribulokinase